MYTLAYDGQPLHDPRTDDVRVFECDCKLETNRAGELMFSIAADHPLRSLLRMKSSEHEVVLCEDGEELFRGRISDIETDWRGTAEVTCEGQLAYLNDSVVRPYGTYANEEEWSTVVSGSPQDLIRWYVAQHDGQSDISKQFRVVKAILPDTSVTRSSTQYPTTGEEISDKLLEPLPCYMWCDYADGERLLTITTEGAGDSEQAIEFGENLLEYASGLSTSDIVTCIIPTGKGDEGEFGIEAYEDGMYGSLYKEGDHLLDPAGVRLYGTIAEQRSYDVETLDGLMAACANDLTESHTVIESVEVSAVDLHHVDPTIRPLRLNQWIPVRSRPLGVNQRMMCVKVNIDISDPTRTRYVLGAELPTLTNANATMRTRTRLQTEEIIQQANAISAEAKAAAITAGEASAAVSTAVDAAEAASSAATTASQEAQAATAVAASKQRVFTAQPTPPYDLGDIWIVGDGMFRYCTTAKEA